MTDLNEKLLEEIENLESQNIELLNENNRLVEDNAAYKELNNRLYNSRSYKITKPLRSLKGFISRLKRFLKRKTKSIVAKSNNVVKIIKNEAKDDIFDLKLSKKELINNLLKFDVISFDIFDTLILRDVQKPTDIFSLIEIEEKKYGFSKNRIEWEKTARDLCDNDCKEITIFDIYKISKLLNIDESIKTEFSYELKHCYANEYFIDIINILKQNGKKIIVTSDMYWPKDYLKELLKSCGIKDITDIYVSCDYGINKGSGKLHKLIKDKYKNKKIVHIGDNKVSDYDMPRKVGLNSYYYRKCTDYNTKSYNKNMSKSLLLSNHNAVTSNNLYNGNIRNNKYYRFGFQYAGFFVYNFLEYINQLVKVNKYDKLIFLSRDADILYKSYKKYFNEIDSEYLKVSRSALLEINFENIVDEYITFYFKPRMIANKYTIEESLIETDLKVLLKYIVDYNMTKNDILNISNYDNLKQLIYDRKDVIVDHFSSSKNKAINYYKKTFSKSKNVLLVDLGWSGTIAKSLRMFINNNVDSNININCAFIGNCDNEITNYYVDLGIFYPYGFSYTNKTYYLDTTNTRENLMIMILEAIFTSDEPSLLKYDAEDVFSISSNNADIVKNIQGGIIGFIDFYIKNKRFIKGNVSPTEAFAPLYYALQDIKKCCNIFKDFMEYEDSLPRFNSYRKMKTLGEIIEKRNLI